MEWRMLHVGAERGVNCENMQALATNIFQRHWEWQEDRRTDLQPGLYKYITAFMASLDVKTAFDVANPSVASKILTLTRVHGHLTAASLAEMQDVPGSACFAKKRDRIQVLEMYSPRRCPRLRCYGAALPNTYSGKLKKWKTNGWVLPFGGQHENEYVLRGMM